MALDDYFEPEVAVTAVVTAVLFSPRARKLIRRGAVYGVAGLLRAGDAVTAFAGNVRQGVQEAGSVAAQKAQSAASQPKVEAAASEAPPTNTTHKKAASKANVEGAG
jgi:hypothetical protein